MGKVRDAMAENEFSKTENVDSTFLGDQEDAGNHRGRSFTEDEGNPQDSNEFMELFRS